MKEWLVDRGQRTGFDLFVVWGLLFVVLIRGASLRVSPQDERGNLLWLPLHMIVTKQRQIASALPRNDVPQQHFSYFSLTDN